MCMGLSLSACCFLLLSSRNNVPYAEKRMQRNRRILFNTNHHFRWSPKSGCIRQFSGNIYILCEPLQLGRCIGSRIWTQTFLKNHWESKINFWRIVIFSLKRAIQAKRFTIITVEVWTLDWIMFRRRILCTFHRTFSVQPIDANLNLIQLK